MNKPSYEEMLEALENAAQLEGSELGEWWSAIVFMSGQLTDNATDEFTKAFKAQVAADYEHLTQNFKVVEEPVRSTRTEKRLEFIG